MNINFEIHPGPSENESSISLLFNSLKIKEGAMGYISTWFFRDSKFKMLRICSYPVGEEGDILDILHLNHMDRKSLF